MSDIYAQHDAAFAHVSAFVVTHRGAVVAKIAFKHPRDGAGRLYAYVHWLGVEMVRGFATGGGYDKMTAACAAAAKKLSVMDLDLSSPHRLAMEAFKRALRLDGGACFDRALRDAGFEVFQAV